MATTFPDSIQTFPTMLDLTTSDVSLVKSYQEAILNNNFALAAQILASITNGDRKIITADYINTINDTINALQTYYEQRWSPAYVVSSSQPVSQETEDFWLQVVQ